MSNRKRYTPEQKVKILREYFEEKRSVADICEKYRVHPNQFYRWKKEFFEKAPSLFASKSRKADPAKEIDVLKDRLKDRNEVIAELLQENLKLKKQHGEL